MDDDTLAWARQRADELIANLGDDDEELLALIRPGGRLEAPPAVQAAPEAPVAPPGPDPAHPKRREVRYALEHPVEVQTADWADFVELYTKDISRGGLFVQSAVAPPLRSTISVRIRLPDGAGKLVLSAEVVHVVATEQAAATGMPPGFGLQLGELSAERRSMLEGLVKHARQMQTADTRTRGPTLDELGVRCSASGSHFRLTLDDAELAELRELRAELASMQRRGDLELLGVAEEAELEELRLAFSRLAARWRPSVNNEARPEVRTLATEIFLRLEQAYQRLSDPGRLARIAARRSAVTSPSSARPRSTTPEESEASTARESGAPEASNARESDGSSARESAGSAAPPGSRQASRLHARALVRRLVDRGSRLTSRLSAKPPPAHVPQAAPPRFNHLLGKAYEHISAKDYAAAERALMAALRIDPASKRAQVLLHFSRARAAVTSRDFEGARRHYEAILRLDPDNAMAKRELVMVSALDH